MSLLDVIRGIPERMGRGMERNIGGLLGIDPENMTEEERRQARRLSQMAVFDAMARGTSPATGLRQAAELLGAQRSEREQRRQAEQRMSAAQQASSQIAGRLLGGAPIPTAPGPAAGDELTGVNVQSQYSRDPMDALRMAMSPAGADAMRVNPLLQAPLQAMLQPQQAEKLYATPNLKDYTRESVQYYLATRDPRYLISLDEAGTPEARQRALLDRERFRQETGIVLPDLFAGQGGGGFAAGGRGSSIATPPIDGAMDDLSPTQQREFLAKQLETETKVVDEALANAKKAIPQLREVHDSLRILYKGRPITGLGAEYSKNFARLGSLVSGRPSQEVQDTELLEALLGRDVFGYIKSLGIGARGLDTQAEREFLQGVMSGEIGMSQDTLIGMTKMREKYLREGLESVNERINSGSLDWYYNIKGRFGTKKQPFEIPTYYTEGDQAIDDATGRKLIFKGGNWRDLVTNQIVR